MGTENDSAGVKLDSTRLLESFDCCNQHCRDWRETFGGLPPSSHAPSCVNYKLETFFRVAPKGQKGPGCILETQAEVDDLCETPDEYDVAKVQMTRDQFENLKEFDGF